MRAGEGAGEVLIEEGCVALLMRFSGILREGKRMGKGRGDTTTGGDTVTSSIGSSRHSPRGDEGEGSGGEGSKVCTATFDSGCCPWW